MRQADIELMLPAVVRRAVLPASPLDALLGVMEAMHQPAEDALASLGDTFHPYRCPDEFVPFLARWVDLERFLSDDGHGTMTLSSGTGRLRQLIATAAHLAQLRGTAAGFLEFLETATGERGFRLEEEVRDEDGVVRPFVVRLHVPGRATRHRDLIRRIVESEKAAYVRCEIMFPLPAPPPGAAAPASLPAPR